MAEQFWRLRPTSLPLSGKLKAKRLDTNPTLYFSLKLSRETFLAPMNV
jgi:hypothetical protein